MRVEVLVYLEVDPVYCISHVLEHALEGHEEVTVFKARVAAEQASEWKNTQQKVT